MTLADSRYGRLLACLDDMRCAAVDQNLADVVGSAVAAEPVAVAELIGELPVAHPHVDALASAHALCVVVAAHDGVEVAGSMPRIASVANRLIGLFNDLDAQVAV